MNNTIEITAASILAVSNAITRKGPKVSKEMYDAHVPQFVSKKGFISPDFMNMILTKDTITAKYREISTDPSDMDTMVEALFTNALTKNDAETARQLISYAFANQLMAAFNCEADLSQAFINEMQGEQSLEKLSFLLSVDPTLADSNTDEFVRKGDAGWEETHVKHLAKTPEVAVLFTL